MCVKSKLRHMARARTMRGSQRRRNYNNADMYNTTSLRADVPPHHDDQRIIAILDDLRQHRSHQGPGQDIVLRIGICNEKAQVYRVVQLQGIDDVLMLSSKLARLGFGYEAGDGQPTDLDGVFIPS